MLKKVEAACKLCGKQFCKKRTEQEYCSAQCRNAAWKKPRKRRLKGPVRGVDEALQTLKGFKVRIYIEGEKELQALGSGWRIVTCQLRGNKVLLHHNGTVAMMKRSAFKKLVAAVRASRAQRRRPSLRLVVSNAKPSVPNAEAA
jgi:hypothetical protein